MYLSDRLWSEQIENVQLSNNIYSTQLSLYTLFVQYVLNGLI